MSNIETSFFGKTKHGEEVQKISLKNKNGLEAVIITYGATLQKMMVPDQAGVVKDVVLGFDDVAGYESDANMYFGCTVGRYANRIAKAEFTLDGQVYKLLANNGENTVHGGGEGSLDKKVWNFKYDEKEGEASCVLTCESPDGEEGYPGHLKVKVTYCLNDDNELFIDYEAESDKKTIINLTNHSYWNLSGEGEASILDHELVLKSNEVTAVDEGLIPTGVFQSVEGALDFRKKKSIGSEIADLEETSTSGYDHNYVIDPQCGSDQHCAILSDPKSGRSLGIRTTEPGIQLYTGNFLGGHPGKGGKAYPHRSALCLETQHYPDSIHHEHFPSVVLEVGDIYRSQTIHHFSLI